MLGLGDGNNLLAEPQPLSLSIYNEGLKVCRTQNIACFSFLTRIRLFAPKKTFNTPAMFRHRKSIDV